MKQFFENMNESYIEKYYPNRSVFGAIAKRTKKASVGVYIFFGLLLAGSAYGVIWSINRLNSYRQNGQTEMESAGITVCVFFAVIALISAFCIGITIYRGNRSTEQWLKKSAENSKLENFEVRTFEQQAMSSDSFILKLVQGAKAALTGASDGILTRDYIYLGDSKMTVFACKDIVSACLVESVYYVGDKTHRKAIPYLAIYLLSKTGVEAFTEVSPETGRAVIEELLHRQPDIKTCDGCILNTQEYKNHKQKITMLDCQQ